MDEQRWRDPDWLAGVYDWIDQRLAELGRHRTGEPEQSHVYPWSTVLRVPTGPANASGAGRHGDVWFKANAASLRHEAALVERIAARRPDVVPPPLATEPATGCLLMADAGEPLRAVTARERSLDRWYDVLTRYAEVQLDTADDVPDLLALGVPDRRLATLPGSYAELVDLIGADRRFREATALVTDLCAELAGYGVPELVQHDDLHDGQVFCRDGRHLILDWADACVSHPFFTLSVTLEGGVAWGLDDVAGSVDIGPFRDAYLRPYAERFAGDLVTAGAGDLVAAGAGAAGRGDLAAAATVAMRLGWACRAVNGHVPGDDERTLTRLRMFLDGRP